MVLDGVVGPAGKHLGHFCPLVAVGSMGQEQYPLFMCFPFFLEDTGVEVVMPALATLFSQSSWYKLGDERPTLRPILFDESSDQVILVVSPRFLFQKSVFVV